ncbi:ArnT family glycosyltransferase [Chitinophaga lutea]
MKYLLIAVAAALLFIPFLGAVHLFDWDEINFAEAAREMIVTGNYSQVQIDFAPFWEKPPLFIWLQALSMQAFGINEFAARFPNAIIGILTLLTLFHIGKRQEGERFGLWWALVYAGSWLPHFYFKSGIIDPTFNYFIFMAVYTAYRVAYAEKPTRMAIFSGIFLGLAVLTKGPAAILIAVLTLGVYWIYNKFRINLRVKHLLLIVLFCFLTTALWFGYEILSNGWWFVREFVIYQWRLFSTPDAGHGGPFFYHWIVLLVGCFPASIFLLSYFQTARSRSIYLAQSAETKDFRVWMWILFWVVLLLFSIVKTKIVHYSSLCYFPLSYLAALQVYRLLEGKLRLRGWNISVMLFIGVVLGLAIALLPLVGVYKQDLIPHIGDRFARANLQADVPFTTWESGFGLAYIIVVIISCVLLFRQKVRQGLLCLFISTIFIIQVTVVHFVPKVERFSQGAAIDYFKSFQGKDVYVKPLDYFSYAHLFYTKKQPSANPLYYKEGTPWLLEGQPDKPAYFICRLGDADKYKAHPNLEFIGEKNGFYFFKRK